MILKRLWFVRGIMMICYEHKRKKLEEIVKAGEYYKKLDEFFKLNEEDEK